MTNINLSLRVKKGLLDEVDALVEGRALNRSDFFGAAVNMLADNPQMAESNIEIVKVDESLLEEALTDRLMFCAVRKLLGSKGLTEARAIINKGSLHIDISKGTLVRFKPPTTIEFELTGDFRIQIDLMPEMDIKLSAAGRVSPITEDLLRYIGSRYEIMFYIPR